MQSLGHPLTILSSVDSTNNYAMRLAHARMTTHGAAWLALEQTSGKGQRGKHWLSNKGENIYLSIVAEPHFLSPNDGFALSAAVALGTYRFVKKHIGQNISIKWPNDIYWGDRKTVGMLIENIIQSSKWLYAVVGIGVNINQVAFDNNLRNPGSLKLATGKTYDIISLTKELCGFVDNSYKELESNPEEVLAAYQDAMYKRNEVVALRRKNEQITVCIKGVTVDGKLIVEENGEIKHFPWGTVEWIL